MANNVETGDLAIIVDTIPSEYWARNTIVSVGPQCLAPCQTRYVTWKVLPPLVSPRGHKVFCMEDWCLRRIKPRGTPEAVPAPPVPELVD